MGQFISIVTGHSEPSAQLLNIYKLLTIKS